MTTLLLILGIAAPLVALVMLLLEPCLWQRYEAWADGFHEWLNQPRPVTTIEEAMQELLREAQP